AVTRRVICVCEAVRESHARRWGWARRRFVTIPNGIARGSGVRAREAVRRELKLEADDPMVLTVGSLTTQKAQHVLLEAFESVAARLPAARLLITGEGPLRSSLEEMARLRLPPGSVRFLGARGDVADLIEACDLFVLSSVREGLSVT